MSLIKISPLYSFPDLPSDPPSYLVTLNRKPLCTWTRQDSLPSAITSFSVISDCLSSYIQLHPYLASFCILGIHEIAFPLMSHSCSLCHIGFMPFKFSPCHLMGISSGRAREMPGPQAVCFCFSALGRTSETTDSI